MSNEVLLLIRLTQVYDQLLFIVLSSHQPEMNLFSLSGAQCLDKFNHTLTHTRHFVYILIQSLIFLPLFLVRKFFFDSEIAFSFRIKIQSIPRNQNEMRRKKNEEK